MGLGWFPIGFSRPIGLASGEVTIWQRLCHLVLPSLTLSFTSFSNIALHTRQKLTGVLSSEYVLFARARGEGKWTILKRHGLRGILLPALCLLALTAGCSGASQQPPAAPTPDPLEQALEGLPDLREELQKREDASSAVPPAAAASTRNF